MSEERILQKYDTTEKDIRTQLNNSLIIHLLVCKNLYRVHESTHHKSTK